MTDASLFTDFLRIGREYSAHCREELRQRWERWEVTLSNNEVYEVLGGLLARQVSLATQVAEAPQIWNEHIAPIILRSMADNFITFCWIFAAPDLRAKQFIQYGLGQEKLLIEHYKARLDTEPEDADKLRDFVEMKEAVLTTHQYPFLTEVNVGSWSGINARKMAEEIGELDFYNFVYLPFSAVVHNMWQHISAFNLNVCENPLHRMHTVPIDRDLTIAHQYPYLGAKYLDMCFRHFDEKTGVGVDAIRSMDFLCDEFSRLGRMRQEMDTDVQDSSSDVPLS